MKFNTPNRSYTSRTDDGSGYDTPTLGSSADSRYSCGLLGHHFSDTTDCEVSYSAKKPNLVYKYQPRAFRPPDYLMAPRVDNSNSVGDKTPLLESKLDCNLTSTQYTSRDGYSKIPGRNLMDNGDLFMNSIQYFDTFKYLKEAKKKQSSLVTIFAVWNTIMGSSLLTMAWGIERAGLLPGLLIMLFMGGLCLFTSYILLKVCYHHADNAECEVIDLCRLLLGRWAEVIAHIFSFIVMLGANIVYWLLMTNFLYYSVDYFRDLSSNSSLPLISSADGYGELLCRNKIVEINETFQINETLPLNGTNIIEKSINTTISPYWDMYSSVPIYVAIIIFPLLNFNTTSFFTKFNSLGTISVLYLMIFVIVKGASWGLHVQSWASEMLVKTDFGVLSGMLALSFYIHNIIITIMRNNRHQEKNGRDLSIAFILVTLTYMLVGAVFYICFPLAKACIEDNILNNFVKSDIMTAVARILLLFQVITVYPLLAYMLRVQILGSSEHGRRGPSRWSVLVFNIMMITVCILFACFVPRIGTIIRYTGALSGFIHIFTLPSLLQMASLHKRGKLTIPKIIFYVAIFSIGAINLVVQFFVGD